MSPVDQTGTSDDGETVGFCRGQNFEVARILLVKLAR